LGLALAILFILFFLFDNKEITFPLSISVVLVIVLRLTIHSIHELNVNKKWWLPKIYREELEIHPLVGLTFTTYRRRWNRERSLEILHQFVVPWNVLHSCNIVEVCNFWGFFFILTLYMRPKADHNYKTLRVGKEIFNKGEDELFTIFTDTRLRLKELVIIRSLMTSYLNFMRNHTNK